MAIQVRRGLQAEFDPSKMLPGEWAVALDTKNIYLCFSAGDVRRMATYEEMTANINSATAEVQTMFTAEVRAAISAATQATSTATTATQNANSAIQTANAATSRANTAAQNAEQYVLGDISSKTVDFIEASQVVNIATGESTATLFGKIKKFISSVTARYIDGVRFDGGTDIAHYAICSTPTGTVAQTATLTGFSLVLGAKVTIKFTNAITVAGATLNVSETGAIPIHYKGVALPANYITANSFVELQYDGTNWNVVGELTEDTGWIQLPMLNGFTAHGGSAAKIPRIRKNGNTVEVAGIVSPPASNTLGSTTRMTICTLPDSSYYPTTDRVMLMQGSGSDVWLLEITAATGNVMAARHRSGGTYTTPLSTAWLAFNVTYLV